MRYESGDSSLVSSDEKMPNSTASLLLTALEFLLIACCIVGFMIAFFYSSNPRTLAYTITALIIFVVSILFIRQLSSRYARIAKQADNERKAQFYSYLFRNSIKDDSIQKC